MPPRWKDLESDERYTKMTPTQQLGVFNKWLSDAKSYGSENGWWDNEKTKQGFTRLVKTKLPQISQAVFEENKVGGFEDVKDATGRAGYALAGTPYRLNQVAADALLGVSKAIDYTPGLVAQGLNKAFGTDLKVESWLTNQLRSVSQANQADIDSLQQKGQALGGGELGDFAEQLTTAGADAIVDVGAAIATGGASVPGTIARQTPTVMQGVVGNLVDNFLGPSGRQLRIASTLGSGRSFSGTWNDAIKEYTDLGFSREEAEAKATPEALNAGASTYLITMLGGKTGVESVLKNSGAQGLKGRLREVITEAASEGIEEGADQSLQDLNERFIRNPDKAVADSLKEIKYAVGLGTLLGGGFSAVGQTVEKLRENNSPLTAEAVTQGWWETPEKTAAKVTEIKAQLDKDFGPDDELLSQQPDDKKIEEQVEDIEDQEGATEEPAAAVTEAPVAIAPAETATTDSAVTPDTVALPPQRMGVQTLTDDAATAPGVDETADVFADVQQRPAPARPTEAPVNVLPTGTDAVLPPQRMGNQDFTNNLNVEPEVDETADVFAGVQQQQQPAPEPAAVAPTIAPAPVIEDTPAPITPAPASSAPGVTNTLPQGPATGQPAAAPQQSAAPAPSAPEAAPAQPTAALPGNQQPPAPAPQPLIAPAPSPDAQAYEDSLVQEARNAGTKITGRKALDIKKDIQGKGWYPKTNVNKAIAEIRDRVRQRLEAEPAPAADTNLAPAPAANPLVASLPQNASELIAESRKQGAVPSSVTINARFGEQGSVQPLPVEQRQAVRREAARQVAADYGIAYDENLEFTKDFDGIDNVPIRITETGTEPVFVNNPDVTARQLDQGLIPTIPQGFRGSVVQGIEFEPETGRVTSAVSRGVTVQLPGQLERGVKAQRPGTTVERSLVSDTETKKMAAQSRKFNKGDLDLYKEIEAQLTSMAPVSPQIGERFSSAELASKALSIWVNERTKDKIRPAADRNNYSARQVWMFANEKAFDRIKNLPKQVSLDAPITETGTLTRGETVAAQDRLADSDEAQIGDAREAAIKEADAIDEGVAADEPADLEGSIGGASTGMNYDQAYNIVNSPRLTQGISKKAVAKLKAEAQELLDLAPQNVIDDLEANDVDYWTFTAEDFRNVDTGNTNQIVSSSPKQKTPYISEQTSWMKLVARALGVRNVSSFTPTQFTRLAEYYAGKFRPFFEQGNTTLPDSALAESLPEIRAILEAPEGAASGYRSAVDRLRAEFPGAKITYSTDHTASAWYNPRFRNQIFLNPLLLEQELNGLSAAEAQPFLKAVLFEEYVHMVERQTIPQEIIMAIAQRLPDNVRQRVIDSYVGTADQFTDPAQRQEILDSLDDLSVGSEYLRMLVQRMRNGQTTEDLAPENLPQNLFEQVMQFLRSLVNRLKARLEVARDPVLAHTINALESQMRVLQIERQFTENPASVSREDLAFARRRGQPTLDIDDIDATLPPGNGWLRPDGSWVAAETISAGDQVQGWEAEMGQFGGHEAAALEFLSMNDPNAYALLQDALNSPDAFDRGYEVVTDYMKRMGWLRVVQQDGDRIVFNGVANKAQEKALFTSAILEEKSLVADNGRRTETIYEPPTGGIVAARPGIRIRGKRVGQVQRKPGGLLSSGAFTTKERDIMLKASQKIAKATANAEFLVNEFRRAVKKAYGKNPVPLDLINQALGSTDNRLTDQQITDLKKIRDKDAREVQRLQYMRDNRDQARIDRRDALAQLPAPVAKAVDAMGAKIDELSVTMMTEGYMSEDLIPVFEENLELYLHRSYAIFESPQWKDNMVRAGEIADAIRDIQDPAERQKAINELPKTTREHVRVRAAFERFAVERAIAEYATEIRRKAKQNNQTLSRQQAIALAKADTDTVSRKASDLVLRYLTVADQDAYRFFTQGRRIPGRRDLDIIKVRGQVPKELREFWGEIKNAETNFTQTTGKMAAFMAHHDVATELLNNGIAEGYIWKAGVSKDPNPNPEYVSLIPKGTASPDSISPLYGAYGPVELRDALVQMTQPQNTAGWARFMSFMTATAMAMKTIGYVPRSFVRNFLGNPLIVLGRGLYNLSDPLSMGKALADGFRVARLNAGLGGNTAYQALRERALELGVIGDNVRGTLLKKLYEESTEGEKINELLKRSEFDSALEKIGVRTGQAVYKGASKLADIYQGVDDIWKMYAWEMEQAKQKAAHPTWNKTQIEEAAAQNVRNLVPTYSLSPDLTQRIRRVPLFAPFITWTSEILRTTGNNISLGKQEIAEGYRTNNNAMIKNGASRLAGFLVATSVLPAFAMAMKAALGYDDEDEEAVRTSLPDWQKNAQLIFLRAKDQGKVSYLDLSYLDPNQVFVEPMIAASRAFKGGSNPFTAWATETLRPVYSEQLFVGAMADIMRNRTADGRPIVNEQDTAANQLYGKMMHAVEAIGPGTLVTTIPNMVSGIRGDISPSGKVYSFGDEVYSAAFGQRISELDSQTTLRRAAGKFMSGNAEATRLLSDTLLSRGTVSVEDIPAAYENANRAKRDLFEELRKNYQSALQLGMPKQKAVLALRNANISQDMVAQVVNDRFVDYAPTKQTYQEVLTRPNGRERLQTLRNHLLQKRKKNRDQNEGQDE